MRRARAIPLAAPCGYLLSRMAQKLSRGLPPKLPGIFRYGHTMEGAYFVRRGLFMPWELGKILDPDFAKAGLATLAPPPWEVSGENAPPVTPLGRVMILESTRYLRNQLLRDADWASMDHSLELRTPWVDARLLTEAGPILAARENPGKAQLALAPHNPLPRRVIRRPKSGFGLPVRSWLAGMLPDSLNGGAVASVSRAQALACLPEKSTHHEFICRKEAFRHA